MPNKSLKQRYMPVGEWNQHCEKTVVTSLSASEQAELNRYKNRQRRQDWLRGRFVAKQLISETCFDSQMSWESISILSQNEQQESVAPTVLIDGMEQPGSLSISHTKRGAWAGICLDQYLRLGVDLAVIEQFSDAFVKTWMTQAEQELIQDNLAKRNETIAIIWAIKEATYKACNTGEAYQPHRCHVSQRDGAKFECRYEYKDRVQSTNVKTDRIDGQVVAIVTSNASESNPHNEPVLVESNFGRNI